MNDKNLKPYKRGQSGNPTGRPNGSKNTKTIIAEFLDGEIPKALIDHEKFKPIKYITNSKHIDHILIANLIIRQLSGNMKAAEILYKLNGDLGAAPVTQTINQQLNIFNALPEKAQTQIDKIIIKHTDGDFSKLIKKSNKSKIDILEEQLDDPNLSVLEAKRIGDILTAQATLIDVQIQRKELHSTKECSKESFRIGRFFREIMHSIPDRISDQLSVIDDANKIQKLLTKEISKNLETIPKGKEFGFLRKKK